MTPYRTPPSVAASDPVRRSRWKRFLCWIGYHAGPFTIWHHSIDCDACGRMVSD